MKRLLLALAFLVAAPLAATTRFFSDTGAGTTCSVGSPGTIGAVMNGTCVGNAAGDIYIGTGTFSGTFTYTNSAGTAANPILVQGSGLCPRSNNAHCAMVIDNASGISGTVALLVNGSHVRFDNFEVMSSKTVTAGRSTSETNSNGNDTNPVFGYAVYTNNSGVAGQSVDVKFTNLVVHDTKQGISLWGAPSTHGMEANGNIIYNNGFRGGDRSHGHGMYGQNDGVTQAIVSKNVYFGGAEQCMQYYGSTTSHEINWLSTYNFALFCNSRTYTYGGFMNPTMDNSIIKFNETTGCDGTGTDCAATGPPVDIGYVPYSTNFTNTDYEFNYTEAGVELVTAFAGSTIANNTFITNIHNGISPSTSPGNLNTWYTGTYGVSPPVKPTTNRLTCYANDYAVGRGQCFLWNWQGLSSVSIDLTGIVSVGDSYEILDVQNWTGAPVKSGTYAGGTVSVTVPTGGTAPIQPLGRDSTVTATNGSPNVTQTGLAIFPTGVIWNGDAITIDGVAYTVSSVTDSTHLVLTGNYTGSTGSHNLFNAQNITTRTTWPQKGVFIIETTAAAGSTPTNTPTNTFTPTFTNTPTKTPTPTATNTPTPSNTPVNTAIPTNTPTNTLTPTKTPTATATPSVFGTTFQAEACVLVAPMASHNDPNAFAGGYISSTVDGSTVPANGGTATCTFSVPDTATYYTWVRVLTPDTNSDSMYVEIDGEGLTSATNIFDMSESKQPCSVSGCNFLSYIYDVLSDPTTQYYWNRLNRRDGTCNGFCGGGNQHGPQRLLSLTAGTHTMKFYGREVGARVDYIILSEDPNYDPSQVAPTPTPVPGNLCKRWVQCHGKAGFIYVPCSQSGKPSPCPWR